MYEKKCLSTLFIKSNYLYIMFNRSLVIVYDAYITYVHKISSHYCLHVCFLLIEEILNNIE